MRTRYALLLVMTAGCGAVHRSALYEETLRSVLARAATPTPAPAPHAAPRVDAPPHAHGEVTHATTGDDGPRDRAEAVALTLRRDPGLRALVLQADASLRAAQGESSLAPPSVSAQVWNAPLARPWALNEAQMFMLELRQSLPAAGQRGARAEARVAQAAGALATWTTRAASLSREVDDAWIDALAGDLHHAVHAEHLAVVQATLEVTRRRYATGGATLDEVARVEAEISRARRNLARYERDRQRGVRTLHALLQQPLDAPWTPPNDASPEVVDAPLDALVTRALTLRGAVAYARAEAARADAMADEAHADATRPMFDLGVSVWVDPMMRPGYGAMAAMTLPWLSGGGRAREDAARREAEAARWMIRDAEAMARREVVDAHGRMQAHADELRVLRDETIPATRRAADAVRAAYGAGRGSLLAWLDIARMDLDLAMELADLQVDLARDVADLERSVGAALPRARVAPEAP